MMMMMMIMKMTLMLLMVTYSVNETCVDVVDLMVMRLQWLLTNLTDPF